MATVTRTTVWVDGNTLTASALNGEFNNLLNAPAIMNADIASNAAIAVSKINTGLSGNLVGDTDTQTLTHKTITDTSNSIGTQTFTNPYKFSVYRNAAQNTGNGAFAIIGFDTALFDTGSNVDLSGNKGRFTAPVAGFYHFSAGFSEGGTLSQIICSIFKNGSEYHRGVSLPAGTGFGTAVVSATIKLAQNDYIEIGAFGNTSAGLVVGSQLGNFFTGFLVSIT